jgi:hypothetical protein
MLQITMTSSQAPIDSVAVAYTTTASNHTWRVEGAATSGNLGTVNLLDSTLIPFWPHLGLELYPYRHAFWRAPTPQTCGAVRITINGLPQFYVGHIRVGLGFQPAINFSFSDGFAFGWRDGSEITEPPSGPPQILAWPRRQSMRLNMNFQTYLDALTFVDLSFLYGASHPLFVVLDPDDTTTGHYLMINALLGWDDPPVQSTPALGRFSVPLSLREYGP